MPINTEFVRRILKAIAMASTLSIALSACSQTSWKEEALQPDGKKIIVERSMDRGGRSEVGQAPPVRTESLSFTKPNSSERITWTSTFSQDIGFADFMPLNVSVVANTAYVVTWPIGCLAYNKWGRPNPPYIVFKHMGTAWQQIPLEELPLSIRTPNIILGSSDIKAKEVGTRAISADQVREVNSTLEQAEFKSILREKINYLLDCIPMVTNGNGLWLATGFFTRTKTVEACEIACHNEKFDEKYCPCKSIFQRK